MLAGRPKETDQSRLNRELLAPAVDGFVKAFNKWIHDHAEELEELRLANSGGQEDNASR